MSVAEALERIHREGPQWRDREGREQITPDRWGRDHLGLLLHVEHRVVDYHGRIDWNLLTLSQRNWPMLYETRKPLARDTNEDAADKYGLRLKGNERLLGHCEADALMDLIDAGLATCTMPPVSPDGQHYLKPNGTPLPDPQPVDLPTWHVEWLLMPWARFAPTDRGWRIAHALRRRKAEGGKLDSLLALMQEGLR